MAKASTAQTSFNNGEVSPLMFAREDLQKYGSSLSVCLNAQVLAQGAWTRRGGTVFMTQAKFHDKQCRLLPFQYSVLQNYILEFSVGYIRFFTNHGILTGAAQTISATSKANPGVLTYAGADNFANDDRVYVTGETGMTQLNGREFKVSGINTGTNTFNLVDSDGNNVDTTNYDTFTGGGLVAKIVEVTTSFTEADLPYIRVVQSADVLYILHPSYGPQKLVRVSATSWTLSTINFTDGPYDLTNTGTTTLKPSATSGNITITASATTAINGGSGFLAGDVGRLVRLNSNTWGYAQITTVSSTTLVSATVLSALGTTAASTGWRMGLWSTTTGFPRAGTFFEDRLVLGGASSYPQRWDASNSSDYENFAPTSQSGAVTNSHAIGFTLNSSDVNGIKWIKDNEKGLLIGTARAEWLAKASSLGEALTPTNVTAKPSTRNGSENVEPVQADKATLFLQRAGRKLRELTYVFQVDGFKAPDMTLLAEHITDPGILELTYQGQPQSNVWAVRADGALIGFTYERDQEVTAWHRHELGGQSDVDATLIPVVESITCVPHPDGTRDEVYLLVRRYVNGQTRRYIELMSDIWHDGMEQTDAFHVDCGFTSVVGTASATVSGLWHLEGETVGAYIDGKKHPDVTVSNGKVTLTQSGYIRTLGYYYNSDGCTMPVKDGAQDGSASTKTRRIARVGFWLLDTLGLKYGPDSGSLTEILTRVWGDNYGEATPLATGVFRGRFEGDYDRLGLVYWRADGPFPATVLAVVPQYDVSDES